MTMIQQNSLGTSIAMAGALAAALYAGAVSADDAAWSHFLAAPGKYILFSCQQLDVQAKANLLRMRELEGLMAKSGSEFANAIAYKPEYLQLRGEQADIQREAADKKCKTAPGAGPQHRVNGAIIR
jgi:hypothetical protein